MKKFRIYYSDGSTFEGLPEDAPADGVIIIATYEETIGRCLLHGWDWYLYRRSEGWYGADLHGVIDHFKNFPLDFYALKQGRTVSTKKFREILKRANKEWPYEE